MLLIDDHLLRGALAGRPPRRVRAARDRGRLATTELYYHRLCASLARSEVAGRLSAPVMELDGAVQARFRREVVALSPDILTVPIRRLAWRMAELRHRFKLSTLVAEALASAEHLEATIALDEADVGPRMETAARELGLDLVTLPAA